MSAFALPNRARRASTITDEGSNSVANAVLSNDKIIKGIKAPTAESPIPFPKSIKQTNNHMCENMAGFSLPTYNWVFLRKNYWPSSRLRKFG